MSKMLQSAPLILFLCVLLGPAGKAVYAYEENSPAEAETAEVQDQIVKISDEVSKLHLEMAKLRSQTKAEKDPGKKGELNVQFEDTRKQRNSLQKLLDELVEEGHTTENTNVDKVLNQAKKFERTQDRESMQREAVSDRKDK